jgi:large subunit ribosomal protein L18
MQRKQKKLIKKRRRVSMGVRRKLHGIPEKPRLSVCRSNRNLSCQAIDDENGVTLAAISSLEADFRSADKVAPLERAKVLGAEMAKRLKDKGVEKVVFDRNWYRYHGVVKSFADAVREGGVRF